MYNEHVTRGMHKVQSKEKNSVACLNRPSYLAVFDLRVVKAVGEENPPELRDAVGVRLVVVLVVRKRSKEVQLNLEKKIIFF